MQEDAGAAPGMEETLQESCPTDHPVSPPPSSPVLNGQLPSSGISVLDRLIKTCPVWLQLCMSPEQATETLRKEASGVFLVTRDVEMKCMALWLHHSPQKEPAHILRYNIREQRTMMYLEGSMLVFKDIFKLVAFYCVSRDILASPLRLPHIISNARTLTELEAISNLGSGFWDSPTRHQRGSSSCPPSAPDPRAKCRLHGVNEARGCACEVFVSADKLWFVDPIFVEEFSNLQTMGKLPLENCEAKPENQLPKIVYRRPPPPPPPPPPPLNKPPLPSIPPSAPPPNYKPSPPHVGSPSHSRLNSSVSKPNSLCPSPPTDSRTMVDLSKLSSPESLSPCSSPTSAKNQPLIVDSPDTLPPISSISPTNAIPTDSVKLESASTEPLANFSPPELSSSHPSVVPLQQTQTDFQLAPSSSETINKEKDFEDTPTAIVDLSLRNMKINSVEEKKDNESNELRPQGSINPSPAKIPPVVPRRRPSGKLLETKTSLEVMKKDLEKKPNPTTPDHKILESETKIQETCVRDLTKLETNVTVPDPPSVNGQKVVPVPPPRRNKLSSKYSSTRSARGKVDQKSSSETQELSKNLDQSCGLKKKDLKDRQQKRSSSEDQKGSDLSLNSNSCEPGTTNTEPDSFSNSSAEDDAERPVGSSLKKTHSFMLDRAKNRLSIVAISNVFTAFMSADRKLGKRIVELAHDKDSYFGNLVQDYKAYSLEMMAKQSSSTEMLQEIRLMMTQLKSYLVQSTELKSMVDYNIYTDDKIDTIVESALCKCVLKPLKAPIECYLREIHNKDGSLRLLTENQLVIQDTTTTDLGVTTSVPDSGVMEKIMQKFLTMHKTYSPEKKITYLLKSCKLIYDSMATGNPGKPHGADDFLPVLMYVLARCDLVALLLDVEYMMELMDPALQLGEGSYYLTTTYGALEHIKNYDKITVTRQLSLEVQDSIHRWERRRTLNKARVSRSSIQDFITISFEELDSKTRTLATKPDTSVTEVLHQCAEKFEVSDPQNYGLFVLVHDRCFRLAEDAFPHQVKSSLLKNEQKLDFHFIYKMSSLQDTLLKELDSI